MRLPEANAGKVTSLDYEPPRRSLRRCIRRGIAVVGLLILTAIWPASQLGGAFGIVILSWTWRSTDVQFPISFQTNCTGASVAMTSSRMIWATRQDRGYVAKSKHGGAIALTCGLRSWRLLRARNNICGLSNRAGESAFRSAAE